MFALWLACRRECPEGTFDDLDRDGFGGAPACEGVARGGDCDDHDVAVFPGAEESCDGVDQDCDGWVDDHPTVPRYLDADGDGFGDPDAPLPNCDAWGSDRPTDCDDADPALNPDTRWYVDVDGDGVGGELAGTGCEPLGVAADGDCDDDDPARFPGAPEACDDVDQDCDPGNEATATWRFPALGSRVVIEVEAAGDVPLALPVTLPGGTDVRVAVQSCQPGRPEAPELPATFLDHATDILGAGGAWDDPRDGVGTVVALWDEDGDLATVEAWPRGPVRLGVYSGRGATPDWPSDLEATADRLATGGMEVGFDAAQGGLLSSLLLDGTDLASQTRADRGNGVTTPAGRLVLGDVAGSVVRLDRSPVTGAVVASAEVANRDGAIGHDTVYRVFAGRRAVLVTPRVATTEDTTISGVTDRTEPIRPVQLALPGPVSCAADPGRRWLVGAGPAGSVAWAWVAPPRWLVTAGCADAEIWTAANDLANGGLGTGNRGTVAAGVPIADAPVLVLLPATALQTDDAREAWLAGVRVTTLE